MEDNQEFLKRFYRYFDLDGFLTIIRIKKFELNNSGEFVKKKRAHVVVFKYHISNLKDFDWGSHLDANADGYDIYFGSALRSAAFGALRGSTSRGGANDCSLSTALSLDIDFEQSGAHEASDLPSGLGDVASIIDGGPAPSMVVNSGYGIHLHWVYEEPKVLSSKLIIKDYRNSRKRAHAPYVKAMKDQGWFCDSTFTVDRIWRLPGFLNWKIPEKPVLVTVLYGLDDELEKHKFTDLYKHTKTDPRVLPAVSLKDTADVVVAAMPKAYSIENLTDSLKAYGLRYEDQSRDPGDDDDPKELLQKASYIKNLLLGESIEEKGNRDFALTKVCGLICHLTSDVDEFSERDLAYIVGELMLPSLQAWVDDSDEDSTDINREIEKAVDKLTRIKAKDTENQDKGLRGLALAFKNRSQRRKKKPCDDDSEVDVVEEPADDEPQKQDLLRSGLIKYGNYTYVWDWVNECYYARFVKDQSDLRAVLRDCWPEADKNCLLKHSFTNEDGNVVDIPMSQLERLYSRAAEHSYYSFCKPQTGYETETRSFVINTAPPRYSKPKFDNSIDDWLHSLGGDEHYETLCRWLAGLNHLDKPCAAIYLDGPPGCGKSLFGLGATQLWSKTVPLYESIVQGFNQNMLRTPVSLIDEGISMDKKNASMIMRRLIAQGSHSVNMKNGPLLFLEGHLRFVIAANNDEVLLTGREEKLSSDDARAMSERIIYIKIDNDDARNMFIKHNQGNRLTDRWLNKGSFAKHVLWLGDTIDMSNGGRFLVEGTSSEMRDRMVFQGDERNLVLEWICLFAEAPMKIQAKTKKGAYAAEIGNGVVAVNVKSMKDRWKAFTQDIEGIDHSHLLRHIKAIATRSKRVRSGGSNVRYWIIPEKLVLLYAETHDIGDIDRIKIHFNRETDLTLRIVKN